MKFKSILEALEEFCEKQHVKFALVGAFGLAAYGLQRDTKDLDLMVEEGSGPIVGRFLESLGYETLQRTEAFSIHVHPLREMGRVDLILVDQATASQIFARARARPLQGRTVLVACPEHLAAMKALAIAQDPTRALKDLGDVQFLLSIPKVDREEIRRHFERYHLGGRYDEICRLLDKAL
ncbi:MAG: nucleotidyltransferase [Candidatus Riflebacteria bacterium]|nr:nucleotidyltransferase [Candidatus Riflebacteria bacterium]